MCVCAFMNAGIITPPFASTNSASGYFRRISAVVPVSFISSFSVTTAPFS